MVSRIKFQGQDKALRTTWGAIIEFGESRLGRCRFLVGGFQAISSIVLRSLRPRLS